MVRISKDYDERKKEIMDTSMNLFLTNGYEDTSVNLIIETIGISKGTFYYYFKSKEDLLDALIERRNKDIINGMLPIAEDEKLTGIEKVNGIFQKAVRVKAEMKQTLHLFYRVLMDPRYLIIRHKTEVKNVESLSPILHKCIEQGIAEGSFNLPKADGIPEMIIKLSSVLNDVILNIYKENNMKIDPKKAMYLTDIYQMAIEGAPEGSIKLYERDDMILAFNRT